MKSTRVQQVKEPVLGSLLGPEEIEAVSRVIKEGQALSRGPEIDKFEEAFAQHLGVKYCVALSSCTAALRLAFSPAWRSSSPISALEWDWPLR